jgi:hypothetical protein
VIDDHRRGSRRARQNEHGGGERRPRERGAAPFPLSAAGVTLFIDAGAGAWLRSVPVSPRAPHLDNRMTTSPRTDFGGLDFEPTDFEDARRALDELPAGVTTARTLEPGYWDGKRRPTLPSDRALSGPAIQWVMALPPAMRPQVLIDRFPRIANRLADCWPRPLERETFLQDLLIDRRGRRRGFPPEVASELEVLRTFAASRP